MGRLGGGTAGRVFATDDRRRGEEKELMEGGGGAWDAEAGPLVARFGCQL